MLQTALVFTALISTNALVYLIKSQVQFSKVAAVILLLAIAGNLLATFMPALISELWGVRLQKVTAHSAGLWFSLICGILIGAAT